MDLSLFGLEVIGGRGDPNVAVLVGNSNEPKALSHKMSDAHEEFKFCQYSADFESPALHEKN